jgi:DNA-binding FadR family transcriptional regulator
VSKLASTIADRIVDDVVAKGWPVGEVLGSEPELLARYGVSRAVLREAVRLVEHMQVARTRRGPGGGLVVVEPTVDAVIDAMVLYLHRVDATLQEVFEARIVLEEIVTELAPGRVGEAELLQLRDLMAQEAAGDIDDPRALHALLASITRNPALELFVEVLNRVSMLYSRDWRELARAGGDEIVHAHSALVDAVVAGDASSARRRMRRHLEAEGEFLRKRRSTRTLLPDDVVLKTGEGTKRAESLARAIARQLVVDGREPGTLVATEPELIEQHQVSRAVLREAVRILEHHHVAMMRRGPGGGLFVATPEPGALTDIAALYLARRGMRLEDLAEVLLGVELALVGLAVDHLDEEGRVRLDLALAREAEATVSELADVGYDLHGVLASMSHNRVLELVALVLMRLSRLHHADRLAARRLPEFEDEVRRSHEGIARAVQAGDEEVARHRMRRHLAAVARLLD